MCCIACCMTILHFEQWPTRIFIPTACCMAWFFSLCCAVCSLRHTKVAQELAKHFQHSQHAFLGRFTISMQFEHVPGLFFFTGPQNEVISHAYFRYRYRHLSYGKRPMFLASPHWCGHALSNWEQNTWFEVHETRVSQESARCCSASVISIFLCFCFLLPGYWYIWTWSLLKVCSQMIPDESCICSTIRSWRPWQMPVTWCSLWGRLRSSGTRPFAATKTCTEEIRRRLCSISEGSWILLPSYFKGCW